MCPSPKRRKYKKAVNPKEINNPLRILEKIKKKVKKTEPNKEKKKGK